jgi:CHAT domain-containing protein
MVLRAVNTAAGAATSAEALSGLARAFIYAQARALLVSHWEVYSDATVKLITASVREMARDPKVGRAEALRRSMLALIDKGKPHEAHPAYWSPFVAVGEGGTEAALTTDATTVTNMKKVPTAAKNQKPAPRPQEDWRVEILR